MNHQAEPQTQTLLSGDHSKLLPSTPWRRRIMSWKLGPSSYRFASKSHEHLYHLTGAFYVGLLDGLLGVAGMMKLLVISSDDWDHSRKFPVFSTSKSNLSVHSQMSLILPMDPNSPAISAYLQPFETSHVWNHQPVHVDIPRPFHGRQVMPLTPLQSQWSIRWRRNQKHGPGHALCTAPLIFEKKPWRTKAIGKKVLVWYVWISMRYIRWYMYICDQMWGMYCSSNSLQYCQHS
jgi:hypothetical protein